MNQQSLSAFLWSVADLLRGDYKQSEYGRVILPFTVLRRLDCVLAPTKEAVLAELQNQGAELVKEDEMGERQLSYPVKDRPRGRYVLYNIKMAPDKIVAAEKVFKLNTNVLKYLFVKVEE